jgi:competence protein ComEC
VIDVWQGTAILIRTAAHTLLYDTGPAYVDSDAGERIVVPYLRATGVDTLSGMIVSHDDNDHSGGMRAVLRDMDTAWLLHGLPRARPLLVDVPRPQHCVRGQHWRWRRSSSSDRASFAGPAGRSSTSSARNGTSRPSG